MKIVDRIDISDPLREICERLDVPYEQVKEVIFRPGDLSVELFVKNSEGSFYIEGDRAVTETREFKVRTW